MTYAIDIGSPGSPRVFTGVGGLVITETAPSGMEPQPWHGATLAEAGLRVFGGQGLRRTPSLTVPGLGTACCFGTVPAESSSGVAPTTNVEA